MFEVFFRVFVLICGKCDFLWHFVVFLLFSTLFDNRTFPTTIRASNKPGYPQNQIHVRLEVDQGTSCAFRCASEDDMFATPWRTTHVGSHTVI